MCADSIDSVPIRGPKGWTDSARQRAASQLQWRLQQVVTPRDVARVGAEYFRDLLDARSASVSTHEDGVYHELANVGVLPPPSSWYPDKTLYPVSIYPLTTQQLKKHGGYFTEDLDDPDYVELVGSCEDPEVVSVMGIAIASGGELRGEVFLAKGRDKAPFDREDLDFARDLATAFGGSRHLAARRAHARAKAKRVGQGVNPPGR